MVVRGNGNKFGIGAYSDYVGPSYQEQIPMAHNLTGAYGFLLMWVQDIPTANLSEWQENLKMAYNHAMRVVLRIDTDYKYVNGAIPSYYKDFISQLPPPPPEVEPLFIVIGNEPNECDPSSWCNETNPNVTVTAQQSAIQAAVFLATLLPTLKDIDFIWASPSPLGITGPPYCKCQWGLPIPPQTVVGTQYLSYMLEAAPNLYEYADFLSSHPYPCSDLMDGQGCLGIEKPENESLPGLAYYRQELKMIGINLPVLITETGWDLFDTEQNNKATWTVQAFQNIYWPDPVVLGVMPFLLTSKVGYGDYDGFDFVASNMTYWPVYNAVREYRCSIGYGPC